MQDPPGRRVIALWGSPRMPLRQQRFMAKGERGGRHAWCGAGRGDAGDSEFWSKGALPLFRRYVTDLRTSCTLLMAPPSREGVEEVFEELVVGGRAFHVGVVGGAVDGEGAAVGDGAGEAFGHADVVR